MTANPSPPAIHGLGDRELLDLLRSDARREAALEALIARHGPLVLSVCRRNTHCPADAEDAFQATFLLLAQKGPGLGRSWAAAAWLYGVALRLCLRIRRDYARRPAEPLIEEPAVDHDPLDELLARHDGQIADEELTALPSKLRAPMVLRYLAGYSNNAAAAELGISVAALEGRLKRAKQRLRVRLVRRGVTLAAVVAVLKTTRVEAGGVPEALATNTHLLLCGAGAEPLSAAADPTHPVQQLALGELKAMNALILPKPFVATAALCGVATLVVGAQIALSQPATEGDAPKLVAEAPSEAPVDEVTPAVELPPVEDQAVASTAGQARLFMPDGTPVPAEAAGAPVALPPTGGRAAPAGTVDVFFPVGASGPVASFPVGDDRLPAPSEERLGLLETGGVTAGQLRDEMMVRLSRTEKHMIRVTRELIDAEASLIRLAQESGSVLAPESAAQNQLDIEQIGRLQSEILAMRREVAVRQGDAERSDYIETLRAEVKELREEVYFRSETNPDLQQRRRDVEVLRETQRDLARRVEQARLTIALLPEAPSKE